MTDEQKQIVTELRKRGLGNGSMGYHSGWMDEAADTIEQQAAEIESIRAENERIRQESVTRETMKVMLDELEQVKRERDAAVWDSGLDTGLCAVCAHYKPNTEDSDCELMHYAGNEIEGECCWAWRGPCKENGGKENDNE